MPSPLMPAIPNQIPRRRNPCSRNRRNFFWKPAIPQRSARERVFERQGLGMGTEELAVRIYCSRKRLGEPVEADAVENLV